MDENERRKGMSRGGSLASTICDVLAKEEFGDQYIRSAMEEISNGQKIRFRLTPHGNPITHWHIRHIKSDKLFIILA